MRREIENPMVLGTPYPPEWDEPVGACIVCGYVAGYGEGAGYMNDDELFCGPECLWTYMKDKEYLTEL